MLRNSSRWRQLQCFRILPLVMMAGIKFRTPLVCAFLPYHKSPFSIRCRSDDLAFQGDPGARPKRLERLSRSHPTSSVDCNLFFRKADNNQSFPQKRSLNAQVLKDLRSPNISIPHQISLDGDGDGDNRNEALVVRLMTPSDVKDLMPMCIQEFGTGSTLGLMDFPVGDLRRVSNWWDRVYFEPSVSLSLRAKMNANLGSTTGFNDPAMLILCQVSSTNVGSPTTETVVGMVEISLQAPEADKNPPPFPVPLWIKDFYCRANGLKIQGWVTNLLIDQKYRGLGYAKVLMAATEGIARSWGCDCIYLHADADSRSGKIPQSLYKGLGYEVVTDDEAEFSWMSNGFNPLSSIRMIEGVPLLCLCKRL